MSDDKGKGPRSSDQGRKAAEDKAERLAAALRENLKRRKAQDRARRDGGDAGGDGGEGGGGS